MYLCTAQCNSHGNIVKFYDNKKTVDFHIAQQCFAWKIMTYENNAMHIAVVKF